MVRKRLDVDMVIYDTDTEEIILLIGEENGRQIRIILRPDGVVDDREGTEQTMTVVRKGGRRRPPGSR